MNNSSKIWDGMDEVSHIKIKIWKMTFLFLNFSIFLLVRVKPTSICTENQRWQLKMTSTVNCTSVAIANLALIAGNSMRWKPVPT